MKIEIWSDYVCPFCYIGERKLELALEQFEYKDEVEIVYKSYELHPDTPKNNKEDIHEYATRKMGMSIKQAKEMHDQIEEQAKLVGLTYHLDGMVLANSFDAHRLSHYAKTEGKANALSERLLKANFTDSLNISQHDVLAALAEEVGLDKEKAYAVLKSDLYAAEVREDQKQASKMGVRGVPYFVFDQKYAVSGAQPSELFLEVLSKVKQEEVKTPIVELTSEGQAQGSVDDPMCADGTCKI